MMDGLTWSTTCLEYDTMKFLQAMGTPKPFSDMIPPSLDAY